MVYLEQWGTRYHQVFICYPSGWNSLKHRDAFSHAFLWQEELHKIHKNSTAASVIKFKNGAIMLGHKEATGMLEMLLVLLIILIFRCVVFPHEEKKTGHSYLLLACV